MPSFFPEFLSFQPKDALVVVIGESGGAQTTLLITNAGPETAAFKVKTTTPDRYLVKPNHGLIRAGQTAEVIIVVPAAKKREILTTARLSGAAKCTDKFLVQSAVVERATAEDLEGKSSQDLAEAVTRLFSAKDKKQLNAKKLLVEFQYQGLSESPLTSVSASSDAERAKENLSLRKASFDTTAPTPIPGTPEAMFAEIIALRKKYEDLVAFTVNLTAERDTLANDVDALAQKRDVATQRAPPALPVQGATTALGFTLVHVALVAAAAFAVGRVLPELLS